MSLMHEYHFSLNGKYKNTHFALNEEQVGVSPTSPSTYSTTHTYTWRGETPLQERKLEWEKEWDMSLNEVSPLLFIGLCKVASPPHSVAHHMPLGLCSKLWKVLKTVEVKIGQEPDPRGSNRA
jgi:hypothetical protein